MMNWKRRKRASIQSRTSTVSRASVLLSEHARASDTRFSFSIQFYPFYRWEPMS